MLCSLCPCSAFAMPSLLNPFLLKAPEWDGASKLCLALEVASIVIMLFFIQHLLPFPNLNYGLNPLNGYRSCALSPEYFRFLSGTIYTPARPTTHQVRIVIPCIVFIATKRLAVPQP